MNKSKLPATPNHKPTSWPNAVKAPATALDPMHWTHARKRQLWSALQRWAPPTRTH